MPTLHIYLLNLIILLVILTPSLFCVVTGEWLTGGMARYRLIFPADGWQSAHVSTSAVWDERSHDPDKPGHHCNGGGPAGVSGAGDLNISNVEQTAEQHDPSHQHSKTTPVLLLSPPQHLTQSTVSTSVLWHPVQQPLTVYFI